MAAIKEILTLAQAVLEENDCFFHDGSPSDDPAYKWTDCKYIYASHLEITNHFSTGYRPLNPEEKLFWEIDDSGCKAKALPEISEIISHLVFLGTLKGKTE